MNRWLSVKLLTRHFLRRFLENDLISPNGDGLVGVSHLVAALVTPGFLVAAGILFKYAFVRGTWERIASHTPEDALLMISMSIIVCGIAASVTWDAFFLESRDHLVLGVLPIEAWQLTLSKFVALGIFTLVLVGAMAAVPTLLVPIFMVQSLGREVLFSQFMMLTLAQAVSVILPGAWTILAIAALRGVLVVILRGPGSRFVGRLVQDLLILGFLAWMMSLPGQLGGLRGVLERGGWLRDWFPAMWFLGVYETTIGLQVPIYSALAGRALVACALVGAVVLVTFPLVPVTGISSFTGLRERRAPRVTSRLRAVLGRVMAGNAMAQAVFSFTLWSLHRSTPHRLYLAAALGAGLAWAGSLVFYAAGAGGMQALATPQSATLQVQAILVLFIGVAVRFGASMPVVLKANWLFKVTEGAPLRGYFRGARAAAWFLTAAPVLVLAPVHVALWGAAAAAYHGAVGLLYAAFVVAVLFRGLTNIPCTAAYVSGQMKLKSRGPLYLVAVWFLTWPPSRLEEQALAGVVSPWLLPVCLVSLLVLVGIWRWRGSRAWPALAFDEPPDDALQRLALSD